MDEVQKMYDEMKFSQARDRTTLLTIANSDSWDFLKYDEEDVKKLFAKMKLRADKMFMLELLMGKLEGKVENG